ncbi:MAG: methyltransferase [Mycobacteriaceae bacterium]|nr:methyltransferase [Mycobacteriaceae bacterium]
MTTTYPGLWETIVTHDGVYAPQHDSRLLVDAMTRSGVVAGRRVLDLCTGTGVVAITAAHLGAASVTAYDICPRAVRCSRANARAAGVAVDVRLGSLTDALSAGPYDVVVSNPPYVPVGPDSHTEVISAHIGSPGAWNAGTTGRLLLDPLCQAAPRLLERGGTLLIVQSEFSGVELSVAKLRALGLDADILSRQWIPFGPVLSARARWLERTGQLHIGRRQEQLVVVRADMR